VNLVILEVEVLTPQLLWSLANGISPRQDTSHVLSVVYPLTSIEFVLDYNVYSLSFEIFILYITKT
jgi:hypothetical protein